MPKGTPASANQAPITVTNDGDAPLVIASGADAIKIEAEDTDGGAATAADFAVVSDDCRGKTLARNASCVVNVGFKPTRSNYTSVARVVIDSNSDDAVERILIAGAQTPPKVLAFHGPTDAVNTAGVDALKALADANDFVVENTSNAATAFTAANLANYRAVVFLDNKGDLLNAAQESALQAYIQGGGGFVGIGGAAEAETANTFITGLIGARPDAASPTAASDQVVVAGDRVHPATRELPLESTVNDVWYRWTTRPTGTVHTVARYRAPGAPPATARRPAAPTGRSRGAATTRAAARSTPAWVAPRPRTASRTCASTCSAPSSGPRASSVAAARPRSCPTTRPTAWSTPPAATWPTPVSRTASPRPPTAGCSTSAARTAVRTPSVAR